jgi:hypothetical protein
MLVFVGSKEGHFICVCGMELSLRRTYGLIDVYVIV